MTPGEKMLERLVPLALSGRSARAFLEDAPSEILDAIEGLTSEVIWLREDLEQREGRHAFAAGIDEPSDGTVKRDPVPTLPDPGRDVPVKRGPGRPRKATT